MAYGMHRIPILDNLPARMPPQEEVRDDMLKGRRAARALEVRELHYVQLREHSR